MMPDAKIISFAQMNMIKRHEIAGENGVTPDGAAAGKKAIIRWPTMSKLDQPLTMQNVRAVFTYYLITVFSASPISAGERSSRQRLPARRISHPPSFTTGNDGARVTHTFAFRRGHAGDVADNRFGHVIFDVSGRFFFRATADLTDHDDRFGLRIFPNSFRISMKLEPGIGSPPMPTQVDWPKP